MKKSLILSQMLKSIVSQALIFFTLIFFHCNEEPKKPIKSANKKIDAKSIPIAKKKIVVDTSSQRILLTGDSMAGGLYFPLTDYCKASHHTLQFKAWTSSTIDAWGNTDTLKQMIKRFKPTYIIFSLGSNELLARDPEKKKPTIEKLVKKFGDIKFVWVGPPNWTEDFGINKTIAQTVGDSNFFLSKNLKLSRDSDGRHPTNKGYSQWADTLASWIMHSKEKPILMVKSRRLIHS